MGKAVIRNIGSDDFAFWQQKGTVQSVTRLCQGVKHWGGRYFGLQAVHKGAGRGGTKVASA